MGAIFTWVRNNLITVVEIVSVVYDALEVVVNGLARLIPGNTVVKKVHALLALVDAPLKKAKDFLLNTVG